MAAALPSVGASGPLPPQLPTPEEMARLTSQMQTTLSQVRAVQAQLDQVVRAYESATDELTAIAGRIADTERKEQALDAELRAAQASIDVRASSIYRSERVGMINVMLSARTYRQFVSVLTLMRSVSQSDIEAMQHARGVREEAANVHRELEGQRVQQQQAILALAGKQRQVNSALAGAGRQYDAVRAEVEKRKAGWSFPVKGAYSYVDTYGAPRLEGTKYYHTHQGTDIFALRGTPVVAVVDGVLEQVGVNYLGGNRLWVRSPGDNWTYYYAHLAGYAPGITTGVHVKKGQVLGYVGNSGDAQGGPVHLHFETHVPSGPATNPYPILRRADPLAH